MSDELKIRCLAVDDEPLALQQLEKYIGEVPWLECVGLCQSAVEARQQMEQQAVDALFLDINMPDLSGLDLVRGLAVTPLVVFTTAYSEYALEGYKVDAVDFLLKPFGAADFQRAAEKVRERFRLLHNQSAAAPAETSDDVLFLKADYKVVRIDINKIRYVEGMSEYLRFHFAGGRQPLVTLLNMKDLAERLPAASFMRIHRSYIINLEKVKEVNKSRVVLDDNTELPIGDLYRDAFTAWLSSHSLTR